jgi:hypothetical protein
MCDVPVRYRLLLVGCILAFFTLAGCSKRSATPPVTGAPESAAPVGPPPGATLAIAGQFFDGSDPAAIRAYLQTVREVKPTKFEVQWSPDTVAIGRDEAMRSLRSISEDGTTYTLSSSEPAVAKLRPGSILWIWDIALRRVTGTFTDGNATVVRTAPVSLTEAFVNADVQFQTPVNFADHYIGYRPHLQREAPPTQTSQRVRRSPFLLVGLQPQQTSPGNDAPPSPGDGTSNGDIDYELDDYGLPAPKPRGVAGKIAGFEYDINYLAQGDKLKVELDARKEEERAGAAESNEIHRDQREEFYEKVKEDRQEKKELAETQAMIAKVTNQQRLVSQQLGLSPNQNKFGQPVSSSVNSALQQQLAADQERLAELHKEYAKELEKQEQTRIKLKALAAAGALAKNVFFLVSDNVDIRFRARADLDQFTLAGGFRVGSGKLTQAAAAFKSLKGHLEFEFVGRLGEVGSGAVSVPVWHIPALFNVPLPVAGLPFVIQLGGDALVKLFLSGRHATIHFLGKYDFGGSEALNADTSKSATEDTLTSTEPEFSGGAMSPGTSGAVVAVQLPRVGVGLGLLGASAVVFIDLVNVLTTTNSAAVAALNPSCSRINWAQVGHVGVDTRLMPLPIPLVETIGSLTLSPKKEILHHEKTVTDPDIPMCRIK